MSEPKNQHIVPQCYLKQFVDPNTPPGQEPYVWIFDRGSKKGKKRAPKNILTEADFYTLKLRTGKKDYTIEETLSQIESKYSTVFEGKIKHKLPLDDRDHIFLCAFVAAMLQRTVKQKESMEAFLDQLITMAEEAERIHGATPKTSVELKQMKENAHKLGIVQMIPIITRILFQMNLAFLCSNGHNSFITSDAPCYLFNSHLQWQRFNGPGLGQKHVEVRMPLSPKISACFSWAYNFRGYLKIDSYWIHESNRMVFGHGHEYFIANSRKIERRWFHRFPLDPIFVWKMLRNEARSKLARLRH